MILILMCMSLIGISSDEADVFLENRVDSNDTNRNALVSGQMRHLARG